MDIKMHNRLITGSFNESKILLIIFVVAMVLRINLNVARQELFFNRPFLVSNLLAGNISDDDRVRGDSLWYIYAAKGFLEGRGVASIPVGLFNWTGDTADWKLIDGQYFVHKIHPPLYPLFLAFCFFIGGFNILAYFIPQIILSSLTCLLIYFIAKELFNKTVALLSGILMAFNIDLIFWSSFARTETLFIFLLVLGFLLLIRGSSKKNLFLIFMSAFIFGLACLTRITFTPFVPIIFLWQIYSFSKNRKEGFKVASLTALIIFLVLLPWGIRNYVLFNQFNVLSDEADILVESIANEEQYKNIAINKGYGSHNSVILKTFVFIKDNFKEYLVSCWHRFMIFWSPFTYVMRPLAKIYKGISWFIIFPAAFWGIIMSLKEWKRGTVLIIIFIFYHALLHAGAFADLGLVYRYPIQPFIYIFAAYTFYEFYKRIKNSDRN